MGRGAGSDRGERNRGIRKESALKSVVTRFHVRVRCLAAFSVVFPVLGNISAPYDPSCSTTSEGEGERARRERERERKSETGEGEGVRESERKNADWTKQLCWLFVLSRDESQSPESRRPLKNTDRTSDL